MNKQEFIKKFKKFFMKLTIFQSLYLLHESLYLKIQIKRAQVRLAEIESDLQTIAGRIAKINSVL